MTVAGMEAHEIAHRLTGVEWAPGQSLTAMTVSHARYIAAGTKRAYRGRAVGLQTYPRWT